MNDDKQYTITINEADKDTSTWSSNTISIGDITYAMPSASESITLDTIDTSFVNDTGSEYTFNVGSTADKVFVDSMPSVHRIQDGNDWKTQSNYR